MVTRNGIQFIPRYAPKVTEHELGTYLGRYSKKGGTRYHWQVQKLSGGRGALLVVACDGHKSRCRGVHDSYVN